MKIIIQKRLIKVTLVGIVLAVLTLFVTQEQLSPPLTLDHLLNVSVPLVKATQQDVSLQKNVLVLFPYQADLPQTELATQSIRREFAEADDLDITLYIEYMDLNRFSNKAYQSQLANLYAAKYSQKLIDLVLVTSGVTLDFWLTHHDQILPDAPSIFYDINSIDLAGRGGQFPPNVTGVVALADRYAKSILWMMQAKPKIDEIILVYGVGEADQGFIAPITSLKNELVGQIKLSDWSNLPLSEIKQRAAGLPPNTAIFYHLMFEDTAGVKYRPIDVVRELTQVSAVPVITAYVQFIGTGTVGGYVYSIEQHAGTASRIGIRILRGESVSDIPVFVDTENSFVFDHLALQRYDISLSALPPQSIIKNRQYTLWELYRRQFIAIAFGFLFLILVIILLMVLNRRLHIAQQSLSLLNVNLESKVKGRTAALTKTNHLMETEIAARILVESEREQLITELQDAFARVQKLEGVLPICSFCKKIRCEDDSWQMIEVYISNHSRAQFITGFARIVPKNIIRSIFRSQRKNEPIAAQQVAIAEKLILVFVEILR